MIYGASKVMRQQGMSPSKLKPPQFFSRGYKVDPLLSTITCRFYFFNKDYFLLGYSLHCKVTEAAE